MILHYIFTMMECNKDRKWYLFISLEIVIYFGGLILLLLWLIMKKLLCRKQKVNVHFVKSEQIDERLKSELESEGVRDEYVCFVAFRLYIGELISTQFIKGKIILLITTIGAAISTSLYLYEIFSVTEVLERCFPLSNWVYCIDLGCNIIFLLHFLLRFAASSSKIEFWFNIFTIVDLFTIPQILFSLYLGREWYGLRFLRIIFLTKIHLVMQTFNVVKSCTLIRIINLLGLFLSIWIGGAGFIHLLENSGDLMSWSKYQNQDPKSFGLCLYFIIVTLSTVGYGDVIASTTMGKVFLIFFILIALAVFASFIPELSEFIFSQSFYTGKYHKESGRKHVIVCGHINFASVSSFLSDFFHEDRSNSNVEVVFINKQEPQDDLKELLKLYFIQVKYFQGTVMNHKDLDRIQMGTADACLILANQNCLHPNDEDAVNIMMAISFKNYSNKCPIIMQLIQFESKIYLENIPSWHKRNGDQIICYSEIELGILAQSCLVPGFSTLLTNLFSVRSEESCQHFAENHSWLKNYMRGTTLEIYSGTLSPFFCNMPYKEIVLFCLQHFNLLLIAIEVPDKCKKTTLIINPLNCKKICKNCIGYFICDSFKDTKPASIYCPTCHSSVKNLNSFKKCKCKEGKNDDMEKGISKIHYEKQIDLQETTLDHNSNLLSSMDLKKTTTRQEFYTCVSQELLKCIIENEHQADDLKDHIILCIFSEEDSPLIGIRNFLTPLRSITIPEIELKEVLIIADKKYIKKEWLEISCFPKIKVVFHSFSIRQIRNLMAIERCSRCVILNAKTNIIDLQNDLYMVDKEIIIANMYLQATYRKNLKRENIRNTLTSINMISDQIKLIHSENKETLQLHLPTLSSNETELSIPIISKLAIESNVQFLDDKEINASKMPNYLRKPFAFGYVFTSNMLDSLLSTAYFSPNAISIMEILISGGNNYNLEDEENDNDEEVCPSARNRINIELAAVENLMNNVNWGKNITYIDLFMEALEQFNTLCLGLYRKRNSTYNTNFVSTIDRYVITSPPSNFPIESSDMVYCLKQLNNY